MKILIDLTFHEDTLILILQLDSTIRCGLINKKIPDTMKTIQKTSKAQIAIPFEFKIIALMLIFYILWICFRLPSSNSL